MKTFLQFLALIGLSLTIVVPAMAEPVSDGKKIYLITAADPSDEKQSKTFQKDADWVEHTFYRSSQQLGYEDLFVFDPNFFKNESTTNKSVTVYNRTENWKGGKTSSVSADEKDTPVLKNLLDAVDSCPAGADDTIVVYWSGHGRYEDDEHILATQSSKDTLKRTDLIAALKSKNVRLVVLLTDACANRAGEVNKVTQTAWQEMMATEPEKAIAAVKEIEPLEPRVYPLFDELFFWHKGFVDINASSKGEKAYSLSFSNTTQEIDRRGNVKDEYTLTSYNMGYFTAALFSEEQWSDFEITAKLRSANSSIDETDYLKYARNHTLKEDKTGRWRIRSVPVKVKVPLGVFPVNAIKRLSWESFEERIKENTKTLYEKALNGEKNSEQATQTPDIKLDVTQITDGLEDRKAQDNAWDFLRVQWIRKNYEQLSRIRGINIDRLRNAYNIAATVLDMLRAAGVKVPSLPFIPGGGRGRLPVRIPGIGSF